MEMDPLLFEESPRTPSSVMATFQAAESEAGLEEEIDAEPVVEPDPAHGDVNALHAAYVVQRDASDGSLASQLRIQSAKDALFSDLHNYLLRIFLQQAPEARLNNIDGGDVANAVCARLLSKNKQGTLTLDSFNQKSKFSTWAYRIFLNMQTDFVRHAARHPAGQELSEDVLYTEPSGREMSCPNLSATDGDDDAAGENSGRCVYSPGVVEAAADKIINAAVLQQITSDLTEWEQTGLQLRGEGYSVREIAKEMKLSKPQAKRLSRLPELLRKRYGKVVHVKAPSSGAQRNLELEHEIVKAEREKFTVTVLEDEYLRVLWEQDGRPFAQYAPTGQDHKGDPLPWTAPPFREPRYTITSLTPGGCHVRDCKGGVYPGGAERVYCDGCGYLMVKRPVGSVIVVKGDESFLPPFQAVPTQSIPEARV